MEAIALAIAPPAPKAPELSGFAKRAWLLLYTEGGRWTAEEIRRWLHLPVDVSKVLSALGEMERGQFLVRMRARNIDNEMVVQFGVDRRCKVPRGVTIDEMWAVLQMGRSS